MNSLSLLCSGIVGAVVGHLLGRLDLPDSEYLTYMALISIAHGLAVNLKEPEEKK